MAKDESGETAGDDADDAKDADDANDAKDVNDTNDANDRDDQDARPQPSPATGEADDWEGSYASTAIAIGIALAAAIGFLAMGR